MAKTKYKVPSERIRLDGFLRMRADGIALDEREQKFLDWYKENRENRKAFTMAKEMMTAVLNGELGEQVQKAVVAGNTDEARAALQDLLGAFGSDDN